MNISHIEHLGIAVKSLEEAIPYYENILAVQCHAHLFSGTLQQIPDFLTFVFPHKITHHCHAA